MNVRLGAHCGLKSDIKVLSKKCPRAGIRKARRHPRQDFNFCGDVSHFTTQL